MVIVILIMTFLTLIVLAMTKNANREQRQALDRQLNSQAFYAAESGINDAKDYVAANHALPGFQDRKDDCNNITGASNGNQFGDKSNLVGQTGIDDSIRYSCVMYNVHPDSLIYESGTSESKIAPIEDVDGLAIKSLTFKWRQTTGDELVFNGCPPNAGVFPVSLDDSNCNAGALRVELVDPDASSRQDLINKSFLSFITPTRNTGQSGSGGNYLTGVGIAQNQGQSGGGGCTANGECSFTIDNIYRNKLILHLRSIYKSNTVTINGEVFNGGSIEKIEFKDAQMMVDSTGRATDVIRRIQVRVPISEYSKRVNVPENALQTSDDICKLLNVLPNNISNPCGL